MAGTPRFKVYNADKEYIGCLKHLEDAAALVSFIGHGATVKDGHSLVVWREGFECISAGESYDQAAIIMNGRILEAYEKARAEHEARNAVAIGQVLS